MPDACSQCGKPPLYQSGEHLLCLECYSKMIEIKHRQEAHNMAMINYLSEQMEYSIFGGTAPRIQIPQAPVNVGPTTLHNINVNHSVIGAINSGEIQKLDVAMSHIRNSGNEELHGALKRLSEAIANDPSFPSKEKNAALEHLAYLAEQAELPKETRKSSMARTILSGLEKTLSASANLSQLWSVTQPYLLRLFE